MKRKLYHIKTKYDCDSMWYSSPEMQFVSKEYARGYINCLRAHLPHPVIQLVNAETKEIVDEYPEGGKVKVN